MRADIPVEPHLWEESRIFTFGEVVGLPTPGGAAVVGLSHESMEIFCSSHFSVGHGFVLIFYFTLFQVGLICIFLFALPWEKWICAKNLIRMIRSFS